ncbi:hypothetical protein ACTFIW_007496 [Dictyostelium discoideum]
MAKISLGICCMEEKLKCNVMKYFIKKLKEFKELEIIEFDSNTIFNLPIQEWPIVDSFLSFYSNGFPLEKAIKYWKLRRPYLVNDLELQLLLQDRQKVNKILEDNDIPCPKSLYVLRDPITNNLITPNFNQSDDYIEVNGNRIYKPFIEKPFNSDDHNNYIYYPKSQGGGCRKLFRKVGNNSSDYFNDINTIRDKGSYTYEEFLKIDDFKDVKIYSTKSFSYSELRKSPSVDGYVERTTMGKEKRSVTNLSDQEVNISSKINKAFKQFVCGFDILRVNGISYVCDVNGWSFVKGDHFKTFYDSTSKSLFEKLFNHFKNRNTIITNISTNTIHNCSIGVAENELQPSSTNTSPEQPTFDFSPSSSPTNLYPSSSSPLFNNLSNLNILNNNNNNNSNNNSIDNDQNNSNSTVTTPPHFDLISSSAYDKHNQDIFSHHIRVYNRQNLNNNNNNNNNNKNNNNSIFSTISVDDSFTGSAI